MQTTVAPDHHVLAQRAQKRRALHQASLPLASAFDTRRPGEHTDRILYLYTARFANGQTQAVTLEPFVIMPLAIGGVLCRYQRSMNYDRQATFARQTKANLLIIIIRPQASLTDRYTFEENHGKRRDA